MREVTVGVEEEFLLLDRRTGRPAPAVRDVIRDARALAGDAAQEELHQAQVEIATKPCRDLDEVRGELVTLRAQMATAAAHYDAVVGVSGTYPGPMGTEGQLVTPKDRYKEMAGNNALLVDEQLICGCHVHVSVGDADEAVQAVNRLRRYLPVLLAISANSPYWEGRDSGFASFRTEVWSRWPTAGPPGRYRDSDEYHTVLDSLVSAGVILDRAMAYWDARPSERFPTVEIRVSDVALSVDDAVAIAGLCRALVIHVLSDSSAPDDFRPVWLRCASWLAARHGLSGELMDPADGTTAPAHQAVKTLLSVLQPALEHTGDAEVMPTLMERVLREGNGADRQRKALEEGGFDALLRLISLTP